MQKLLLLIVMALGFLNVNAQQRLIKGAVTDENNQPLPGATVRVKEGNASAVTDASGSFQINVGGQSAPVLIVSYIGYTQQEVPVNGEAVVSVRLRQDQRALNDVVVVGYGVQRKRDVTGATSTVKSDEIIKRPLVRVEQALQGTTSGVSVASTSGQPGAGLSVRIRGTNSITGSNEPLYVIDGYIGGSVESINPNDIESLEILKDASATAIYGSRGSNGVVLITTKSGREGKTRVDVSTWFSKASVPKQLDLMNAYDFARTVNTQFQLSGNPPAFSDERLQELRSQGGTNWQKELQQKPWIQNYQVAVSGGNAGVRYLFSFNHLDQPGLILNQYYKRTTLRNNVDVKLNERMDLKLNVTALMPQSRNTGYPGDLLDPFAQATQWDPTTPVRDANGKFVLSAPYGSIQINPVAQAMNQQVDNNTTNLTGTGVFTWRILKGLTFTSNNTYEIQWQMTRQLFGKETSLGMAGRDFASNGTNRYRSYQNSNFLTYSNRFGDHSITVTALYEQQNRRNINSNAQAVNLSSYALGYYNLGLGTTQLTTSGYWADALQSYMGRVNYSYKEKYLLTASIRTDGSSHLLEKYSTFPSLALGWNITKEGFMEDNGIFTDLKLRASYGVTGNQAVGAYATIPQISTGQPYYFDGSKPSVSTPLGAPVSNTLKWERTTQYDVGLDAAFLNGRLTFTADAYQKKIRDLLYYYQAPFYMGGGTYARNIGSVENKGLEFSLGGTPVSRGKFRWSSNAVLAFNRNKVVDLGGLDNVVVNNIGSPQTNVSILKVGQPLGEFYGYRFLGTWKTSEAAEAAQFGMKPGDAKYTDVDGDKKYTAADRMTIGNGTPKFTFGWINDLNYGNLSLSFMFQGAGGQKIYSQTLAYVWGGLGDAKNATTREALNIWTPQNETDNPSFSSTSTNFINSSRYVYDAGYIKLKNLSLTYRVPAGLLNRAMLRNLEVYVSGQNIFIVTSYPGYDPEITNATNAITQGLEMGVIPNPRTYTVGLRAGF